MIARAICSNTGTKKIATMGYKAFPPPPYSLYPSTSDYHTDLRMSLARVNYIYLALTNEYSGYNLYLLYSHKSICLGVLVTISSNQL